VQGPAVLRRQRAVQPLGEVTVVQHILDGNLNHGPKRAVSLRRFGRSLLATKSRRAPIVDPIRRTILADPTRMGRADPEYREPLRHRGQHRCAWRNNVFVERLWCSVQYISEPTTAWPRPSHRLASITTSTTGDDLTRALTGALTSPRCQSAWEPNHGRHSTYRRRNSDNRVRLRALPPNSSTKRFPDGTDSNSAWRNGS